MGAMRRCSTTLAAMAFLLAGCAGEPGTVGSRPVVVVSVLPQAGFVERIAGDRVDVEVMLPPGANPTTFEPSISQMQAVSRAVLYVKVGHPDFTFERGWLETLLAQQPGLPVVDSSEGLPTLDEDPHVWVAPRAARSGARRIHEALARLLPEAREELDANLASLLEEIDSVDEEIRRSLKPHRGRAFLVFHPAWGYFAEAYGLEQVSIEHEGKEPNPADLLALLRTVDAEGIRVVLVQPQFSREAAELVAREIGAEVRVADPLARDWAEGLRQVAGALTNAWVD